MYRRLSFLLGGLVAGLIQGASFSQLGLFQDSEIYYFLYGNIIENGFYDTAFNFTIQTSKFEPVFLIILWVQRFLFGESLSESYFIILNIMLINGVLAYVFSKIISKNYRHKYYLFLIGFVVLSGYLILSKNMYFWRSIYSTCFMLLMIKSIGLKRIFWGVVAILTHSSSFLFIFLFLVSDGVSSIHKKYAYLIFFSLIISFALFREVLIEHLDFSVSGGVVEVFTAAGGEHAIKVWLSIFYSILIHSLIHKTYINNESLRPIYLFSLAVLVFSLLSFNSYHLMNRVFLPASLIVGFLPFLVKCNCFKISVARFLVVLSVLPAVRLNYMLLSGQFYPA